MAVAPLVRRRRARGRKAREILRQGPLQLALMRAGRQTHIRCDLQPPHERPGHFPQHPGLGRAHGQRHRGLDRRALRFAGVGVQPGRHIHGQHRQARRIDALDEADPLRAERPIQADAEQPIHDQRRARRQQRVQLRQVRGGVRHVQHLDPAVGQVFAGAAGVLPVMAFAGEDQDQVPGLGQLEGAAGHALPDAANDFRFLLTGGPGGLFPVAHLCNADYRHWHGAGRYTLSAAAKVESRGVKRETGNVVRGAWCVVRDNGDQSAKVMMEQVFSIHASRLRAATLRAWLQIGPDEQLSSV